MAQPEGNVDPRAEQRWSQALQRCKPLSTVERIDYAADVAIVLAWGWWRLVALFVAAALLAFLTHLVLTAFFAVGPWIGVPGTIVEWAALIFVLMLLTRAYWRSIREPNSEARRLAVVLLTLTSAFMSIEAFASLQTDLWQLHVVTGSPRGGFADAESLFAWHALNGVPGLRVPDTIGWNDPFPATGGIEAWIVFAFQLVLIVPTVRIAFDLYSFVTQDRQPVSDSAVALADDYRIARFLVEKGGTRARATMKWSECIYNVGWIVLTYVVVLGLLDGLPGLFSVAVWPFALRLAWLTLSMTAVTGLGYLCLRQARRALDNANSAGSQAVIAAQIVISSTWIPAGTAAFAVALWQLGVARPMGWSSGVGQGRRLVVDEWSRILRALPGPSIPGIPSPLPATATGLLGGVVVLIGVATWFIIVLFPVARLVRRLWVADRSTARLKSVQDALQQALDLIYRRHMLAIQSRQAARQPGDPAVPRMTFGLEPLALEVARDPASPTEDDVKQCVQIVARNLTSLARYDTAGCNAAAGMIDALTGWNDAVGQIERRGWAQDPSYVEWVQYEEGLWDSFDGWLRKPFSKDLRKARLRAYAQAKKIMDMLAILNGKVPRRYRILNPAEPVD